MLQCISNGRVRQYTIHLALSACDACLVQVQGLKTLDQILRFLSGRKMQFAVTENFDLDYIHMVENRRQQ